MDTNHSEIEERLKKLVALQHIPDTPMHKPVAQVPINSQQEEILLNNGLSAGKLESMKRYAVELVRKYPHMPQWKVRQKICKQYNVELK